MATMIRPTEVPKPILDILTDITLSMGEKLLLLEGLFVHDTASGPLVGRAGQPVA